jgi:hypothetical protein
MWAAPRHAERLGEPQPEPHALTDDESLLEEIERYESANFLLAGRSISSRFASLCKTKSLGTRPEGFATHVRDALAHLTDSSRSLAAIGPDEYVYEICRDAEEKFAFILREWHAMPTLIDPLLQESTNLATAFDRERLDFLRQVTAREEGLAKAQDDRTRELATAWKAWKRRWKAAVAPLKDSVVQVATAAEPERDVPPLKMLVTAPSRCCGN